MAIEDIISEEIETRAPNMEVAQGGPEDFMTEDEMDPSQDPELQQLLESLPGEQAEVLMQLIKEFKMAVAQGFEGEFEDFVKMKMASAQGGSEEDFMSEEEMQIGPEEQQSLIPMSQQVAQGGRIGYDQGGGIMDVAVEEQVETAPTPQQLIMQWLEARGLPPTPENIQKAILEMSREGQAPTMPREQMNVPPMEAPRPPTGEGYVPEELIGQTGAEVAEMGPRGEEVVSEEEILPQEKPYTQDMFSDSVESLLKGMYGAPDSKEYLQSLLEKEKYEFKQNNPDFPDERIDEIIREKQFNIDNRLQDQFIKGSPAPFNLAQGGRIGYDHGGRARYGLGSLVKKIFKGGKKLVKGLTKSVKKFVKSPIGKMALGYLATAGLANIALPGKAMWGGGLKPGGWLRPSSVMGNLGKSYTNLFKGADKVSEAASKLTSAPTDSAWAQTVGQNYLKPTPDKTSLVSKFGQSFKKSPFPWIAGTAGLAGLYTAKNPGVDNIDELMRNYKGEVSDWDKMLADIRSGKNSTAFSTANTDFPYPDYMNLAQGGRIGRAEGGLMDLGGMEKDYRAEGGFVPIGGKEKADDVPARLSRNEFVFTADAVRNAGGGDVDKGSEVMENIMTNLEKGGSISEESQGLEGARDMFEVSERLSEVV